MLLLYVTLSRSSPRILVSGLLRISVVLTFSWVSESLRLFGRSEARRQQPFIAIQTRVKAARNQRLMCTCCRNDIEWDSVKGLTGVWLSVNRSPVHRALQPCLCEMSWARTACRCPRVHMTLRMDTAMPGLVEVTQPVCRCLQQDARVYQCTYCDVWTHF
jgi:hypothetical protein